MNKLEAKILMDLKKIDRKAAGGMISNIGMAKPKRTAALTDPAKIKATKNALAKWDELIKLLQDGRNSIVELTEQYSDAEEDPEWAQKMDAEAKFVDEVVKKYTNELG